MTPFLPFLPSLSTILTTTLTWSCDLAGGRFPCQPFSALGDQPGIGGDDDKGRLFLEITRLLNHHTPKAFLLENVPGLLVCGGGDVVG